MIIKIVNADTAQNELCLLEFQGELVGDLAGNDLGSLKIVKERAEMIIGTHFLEGKVVKLSKPFLVTQDHKIGSETEFIVLGTAYRKILFSNRPKIRTTL